MYIPLGGNRHGPLRYAFAAMVTMGACGLWHGAGWTYVTWGLLHGIGLIVCVAYQSVGRALPAAVGWLVTMLFVIVGWVDLSARRPSLSRRTCWLQWPGCTALAAS